MNNKIIAVLAAIIIGGVFIGIEPIAQPQNYYNFSDNKNYFGINNFWNVVSNIPFLVVGVAGIYLDARKKLIHDNFSGYPVYRIFFLGVLLTCFGSGWFHLNPNNDTLVWDRLPMTVGFMALTAGLMSEYLQPELQKKLLYPLLLTGLVSVIYWQYTESHNRGDLRLYGLVQFLPMLIIPAVALTNRSRFSRGSDLLWVIGFYGIAKLAEHFDREIYAGLGGASGHTIKHLAAAVATYMLLRMLLLRQRR